MSKETRNLVIVAVIALLLGYVAGGVMQTGRCPLTGMVICKDRAAVCDKAKACAASCPTENTESEAPAAATDSSN